MANDGADGLESDRQTEAVVRDEDPWPSWHGIAVNDLEGFDIEAPIAGSASVDCHELSALYRAAASPGKDDPPAVHACRAFAFVADVLGMHFKPEERYEPFGAMIAWADGRRSAILSDFAPYAEVLARVAGRATNPALKARTADTCWLLDRKRGVMAVTAMDAYVGIVTGVDRRDLKYGLAVVEGILGRDTCAHLRRALFIGLGVGRNKAEVAAVRQLAKDLKGRAAGQGQVQALLWLSDLDLQFGITPNAADLATAMEAAIMGLPSGENPNFVVDLWRFASRAYFRANREDDAHRCRNEAAELLVLQADAIQSSSSTMAAHLLSSAVAQLSGSSAHKARRQELRHRLVDVQAGVLDELTAFSHPIELRELIERTQARMEKVGLLTKLLIFASLTQSPEPDDLVRKAKETLKAHPLSSMFGASHLDHEGKVIHRTASAGMGDAGDGAVMSQVAQAERVRRQVVVSGMVDPARQAIAADHHIPGDGLHALLQLSPSVPPSLVGTFAYGLVRFLQGDFVAASYVLTPMLEAMLRHLLKSAGHDPTTFDDVTETQEDRTISSMFSQMRPELNAILGAALASDLENVFLKKPGPHLRHAFAHGLVSDAAPWDSDAVYGMWLVLRMALLPLVAHWHDIEAPADWLDPS